MNFHQIRYVLAVAETGSFTKGAERCFVSQPTLSAGIKKLEDELGASLFDRGRRATLTPAGIRFHDRARIIAQEYDAAKAEFQRAEPQHRLRLGVLKSLGGGPLGRLLADFSAAHGDVILDLVDGTDEELAQGLRRDRIDAAIRALPSPAGGQEAAVPLFRDRLHLAVSSRHRLARRQSVRLAELKGEPFILRGHCEIHNQARRHFADQRLRPRIVYRSEQDSWTLSLVAAGLAHAVMSATFQAPGVTFVAFADLDISRTVGLAWRPDHDSEIIDRFRAFATSHDWLAHGPSDEAAARQAWAH